MNRKLFLIALTALTSVLLTIAAVSAQGPKPQSPQAPLGTGFTYQGQLKKNNAPVNDNTCSMTFSLWDSQGNSTGQIGSDQTINPVVVSNGLFTVLLNGGSEFGASAFDGSARWLEVAVQCTNDGSPTTLARQQLTASPYALYALAATSATTATVALNNWALSGNAGTLAPTNFVGTTDAQPLVLKTNGAEAMRIKSNGNVGIGTTNPGAQLEVDTTSGNGNAGLFQVNNPNSNYAALVGVTNGTGNAGFFRTDSMTNTYAVLAGVTYVGNGPAVYGETHGAGAAVDGYTYGTGNAGSFTINNPNNSNDALQASTNGTGRAAFFGGKVQINSAVTPPTGLPAGNNGLLLGSAGDTAYKWIQSYGGALSLNPQGNNVGIGVMTPTHLLQLNGGAYSDGSSWQNASDRNAKMNFNDVDTREVLAKVAALPIESWSYKSEPASIHHIGPMAQDFYAAFGVGADDTHISTVDAEGVAFAAIQGLYQVVQEQDAQIVALQGQNAALQARLSALEQRAASDKAAPQFAASIGADGRTLILSLTLALLIGYHVRRERSR